MRLLLGCLASTALVTPAIAAAPMWTISEASPGVVVVHAGLSKTALRGGHAAPGDMVVTGANARAVLVRGEEYAVVAPNSRLQVTDPAQSGGLMQMLERAGNVVFSVRKMASPHFGVQTPYLAAVVKGTTFSVTVDENGASVQVVEGAVEVATNDGGARELVLPGSVAKVRAADLATLTLQGPVNRSVHSPLAGAQPLPTHAATGGTVVAIEPAPVAAIAVRSGTAAPGATTVIAEAVEEAPQSLSDLTGGLVASSTALKAAVATSAGSGAEHSVDIATARIGSASGGSSAAGSETGAGAGAASGGNGTGTPASGGSSSASGSGSGATTSASGAGSASGASSGGGATSGGSVTTGSTGSAGSSTGSPTSSGSSAGSTGSSASSGTAAGSTGTSTSSGSTTGSGGSSTSSGTATGSTGTSTSSGSAIGSTGSSTSSGTATGSTGTSTSSGTGTSSTGTSTSTSTGTGTDNGKGNGGTNNGNQNGKGSGNSASSSSSSSATTSSTSTGTGTDNGKGNSGTNNGKQTGKNG